MWGKETGPSPTALSYHYLRLLSLFALLVSNAARCLASRLTRCLALTATTVLNGLCNIFSFNSFTSAHCYILQIGEFYTYVDIISHTKNNVKRIEKNKDEIERRNREIQKSNKQKKDQGK